MSAPNLAQIPAKLYEILAPLSAEDRVRAVKATLILLGDGAEGVVAETPPPGGSATDTGRQGSSDSPSADPGSYFDRKAPQNKGETLAVAARYLEECEGQEKHTKADLKRVITAARRNFDSANFARDMGNARRQAGFFNLNTGRDASQLSYFGQQYVDALPDRDAAGKLKRPKVGGAKKRTTKRKTDSDGK